MPYRIKGVVINSSNTAICNNGSEFLQEDLYEDYIAPFTHFCQVLAYLKFNCDIYNVYTFFDSFIRLIKGSKYDYYVEDSHVYTMGTGQVCAGLKCI